MIETGTAAQRGSGATPVARGPARAVPADLHFPERPSAFVEIDAVRHWYSPALVAQAEERAAALDIGADEVLIAAGLLSEPTYLYALADAHGLDFLDLDQTPAASCPLADDQLFDAAQTGLLPIRFARQLRWAVAVRGRALRRLIGFIEMDPRLKERIVLASPQQLRGFVERKAERALASLAAERLRERTPHASAASGNARIARALAGAAALIGGAAFAAPSLVANAVMLAVSGLFIAWSAMRLAAAFAPARQRALADAPSSAQALPTYTIVAALYREAASLPGLIAALCALDYPAEKVQILLVLEADDAATRAAAAALPRGVCEILVAPAGGPRTKPKALNAALPFARGDLIVVFDAEDRPEPGQLREAARHFAADRDGTLGCVQARLTIDNSADSWLTHVFTGEYAGQFDVLLPGLAARGWPIPLGGSSNHFRTELIRRIGAWDPYNVTEDADLGIRLARFGLRTHVADASTFEEAPARLDPWIRQRTRWFKGWLQTWFVHMRRPLRLYRELGAAGFATFQLFLAGTVFAALLQPIGWALIVASHVFDEALRDLVGVVPPALLALHAIAMVAGYATSILIAAVGLRRRGLLTRREAARLPLRMAGHWVLLSVAAWRALFQFAFNRFHWEKTEHGLARTSRRAA